VGQSTKNLREGGYVWSDARKFDGWSSFSLQIRKWVINLTKNTLDIAPTYPTYSWSYNPLTHCEPWRSWYWLVVYLPLWKILVSWDDDIPNIWEVIKFHGSKPPTSNIIFVNQGLPQLLVSDIPPYVGSPGRLEWIVSTLHGPCVESVLHEDWTSRRSPICEFLGKFPGCLEDLGFDVAAGFYWSIHRKNPKSGAVTNITWPTWISHNIKVVTWHAASKHDLLWQRTANFQLDTDLWDVSTI